MWRFDFRDVISNYASQSTEVSFCVPTFLSQGDALQSSTSSSSLSVLTTKSLLDYKDFSVLLIS